MYSDTSWRLSNAISAVPSKRKATGWGGGGDEVMVRAEEPGKQGNQYGEEVGWDGEGMGQDREEAGCGKE